MGSNSGRKSGSSGRSTPRKRVVIGADETVRVRYRHDRPQVESERRPKRARKPERRPSETPKAGQRLSNAKRLERERRQKAVRMKRTAALVGLAAILLACLWGAVALYRAQVFPIENVAVSGNSRYSRDAVLDLANIPADATLLRLSTSDVRERLEADPWIASAKVSRDFPSTLSIAVTERRGVAVIDGGGEELWVVSADGRWLGKRSAEDTGLALVRDVDRIEPKPGERVHEPEVTNAIKVVQGLSDELRSSVKLVSAASVDETKLVTKKNVEIFVGEATDITEKDRVVREILKRQKGKVVYINVRVLDRPTWRGLEPEGQ